MTLLASRHGPGESSNKARTPRRSIALGFVHNQPIHTPPGKVITSTNSDGQLTIPESAMGQDPRIHTSIGIE